MFAGGALLQNFVFRLSASAQGLNSLRAHERTRIATLLRVGAGIAASNGIGRSLHLASKDRPPTPGRQHLHISSASQQLLCVASILPCNRVRILRKSKCCIRLLLSPWLSPVRPIVAAQSPLKTMLTCRAWVLPSNRLGYLRIHL